MKCKTVVNIRTSHLENDLELNIKPVSSIQIQTKFQKLGTCVVFVPVDNLGVNILNQPIRLRTYAKIVQIKTVYSYPIN